LIYTGCVRYLVEKLSYDPKVFEGIDYDHSFFVRGVLLDKVEGNFVHISADRKVQTAIHGRNKKLTKEEIDKVRFPLSRTISSTFISDFLDLPQRAGRLRGVHLRALLGAHVLV